MVVSGQGKAVDNGDGDEDAEAELLAMLGARGRTLGSSRSPSSLSPRPSGEVLPEGSKVPKCGVYMVSLLGIVIIVWGIYFIFGYLDPWGSLLTPTGMQESHSPSSQSELFVGWSLGTCERKKARHFLFLFVARNSYEAFAGRLRSSCQRF